jgi:hypothetical protein
VKAWPTANVVPAAGDVMETLGAVFPEVMRTVAGVEKAKWLSRARSVAV